MSSHNRFYLLVLLCVATLPAYTQENPDVAVSNQGHCLQSGETQYVRSPDGTRIAFDVTGNGPTVILLHGGGHTRQNWHDAGYVDRLKGSFQVIAIDIRGNGESNKPIDPAAYAVDKLKQDVLAVADTCGVDSFVLWGFSYGSNISRYLAAGSNRVAGAVLIGVTFGRGAEGEFRASIKPMVDHWRPILEAHLNNTLDPDTLSERDRTILQEQNPFQSFAWVSAILDWGVILPEDVRSPALWVIGTEDTSVMANLKRYQSGLSNSSVRTRIFEGLNHVQTFTEIDRVLPAMMEFTNSVTE